MESDSDAAIECIAIPYGVSLEGLLDVIGAWYQAQGHTRPLKPQEVGRRIRSSGKAESKAKTVSRQTSFLVQIGVLTKVGLSYRLTDMGRELSKSVDFGREEAFGRTMRKAITEWPQAEPLLERIREGSGVPRQALVERIVQEAGKSMDTNNAVLGGNALVALFERVGLVTEEEGFLTPAEVSETSESLSEAPTTLTGAPSTSVLQMNKYFKGAENVVQIVVQVLAAKHLD